VDPTVGVALERAGYDRDFALLEAEGPAQEKVAHQVVGWQAVELDARGGRVRLPEGVKLDLGASAKAMASDMAAKAASRKLGGRGVLVNLGGDIAVAGEAPRGGWIVQASEDSGAEMSDAEEKIAIWVGGVATSSIKARQWRRGGEEYHHIIDPRTSLSAGGCWRTASVVARSCTMANIASTAAIVMGEEATGWLLRQGVAARLVDRQGQIERVGGWPSEAEAQAAGREARSRAMTSTTISS
jgi:thiamine biosynthesis lipoprotein